MQPLADIFDECVEQALETVPEPFAQYLDEIPVVIEELPNREICQKLGLSSPTNLLGLYRGVPLKHRHVAHAGSVDQIVLYRRNLLRICRSRPELIERVRTVLVHELGHYLGFSEAQLRQHGY